MQIEHFNLLKSVIKFDSLIYGNNNTVNLSNDIKNKYEINEIILLLEYLKSNSINYSNEISKFSNYF